MDQQKPYLERIIGPDGFWNVLIWNSEEKFFGQTLQLIQAAVVQQTNGHEIGRVVDLEEVVQLVLEIAVRTLRKIQGLSGACGKSTEGVILVGSGSLHL